MTPAIWETIRLPAFLGSMGSNREGGNILPVEAGCFRGWSWQWANFVQIKRLEGLGGEGSW